MCRLLVSLLVLISLASFLASVQSSSSSLVVRRLGRLGHGHVQNHRHGDDQTLSADSTTTTTVLTKHAYELMCGYHKRFVAGTIDAERKKKYEKLLGQASQEQKERMYSGAAAKEFAENNPLFKAVREHQKCAEQTKNKMQQQAKDAYNDNIRVAEAIDKQVPVLDGICAKYAKKAMDDEERIAFESVLKDGKDIATDEVVKQGCGCITQ